MVTIEIIIMGRVQKVGFRACARRIANDLIITGTVMNLTDGRVQIHATGESIILEKFISMLYGCPRSVIRDLKTKEIDIKIFDNFSIIKSDGSTNIGL